MFAEDDGDLAANDVTEDVTTDIDANDIDEVSDDGTDNITDTDEGELEVSTKDSKKSTKEYSERLKADRAKIREELEKEHNEKLNRIAKARGFDNWEELEEYSNRQKLEELGVEDTDAFKNYLNEEGSYYQNRYNSYQNNTYKRPSYSESGYYPDVDESYSTYGKIKSFAPSYKANSKPSAVNNGQKYNKGMRVLHAKFGEGVIFDVENNASGQIIKVAFKNVGIKTLSSQFAPLTIIE